MLHWLSVCGRPVSAGCNPEPHANPLEQLLRYFALDTVAPKKLTNGGLTLRTPAGQVHVPIQATGVSHSFAVQHFVDGLAQQQLLDRQLLLFA